MNKIIFPRDEGQHYYRYHYTFFLKLFQYAGIDIEYSPSTELDRVRFTINVDGKEVLIDFSDHLQLLPEVRNYKYCFKSHYDHYTCSTFENVYPFTPVSFHDWNQYYTIKDKIEYKCNNDIILNKQKIGSTGAKMRRIKVQKLLKLKYKNMVDFSIDDKENFYKRINNCLISVCVPGARNDILDGGQIQYMSFGACTISPILRTELTFKRKLVPNVHYIPCQQDYFDLIDKIEWCKNHREKCRKIGRNAKELFANNYTPKKVIEWIDRILKGGK